MNIILLSAAAAIAWWLSGFDSRLTGESVKADLLRRGIRCGLALFLLAILFSLPYSIASAPPMLLIVGLLALIWTGCVTELGARGFHRLVDPEDKREFDPHQSARNMDMVASLLKSGRHEEAAQLCAALKKSGDANILVLETLLARCGIQFENDRKPKPLTEAYRLRSEGKYDEAAAILNSLLAENPSNVDAALMLMRLYVQDLRRSDKAAEVLRGLEKQPHIPPGHIDYARRSIQDWGRPKRAPAAEVLPESVDELLACGYLGTAIEILERTVREQPQDFDAWLKLAEAQGLHSGNIHRAEKIVKKIERSPGFSAEQIRTAKVKLKEWREAKPQQN
ncbi:MAG TPA: tetratricopeptide repeat protein [Candidatus Paceibacterota bacterium]|nr:tetratricopeptide repeat protein [Candidatus Paceibacterota bacterium]